MPSGLLQGDVVPGRAAAQLLLEEHLQAKLGDQSLTVAADLPDLQNYGHVPDSYASLEMGQKNLLKGAVAQL